jgi:RimJ/RimL family protein N-acetyltransferase
MSRPLAEIIRGRQIDLVEIAPVHFERVIEWRNDAENRRCFFTQRNLTLDGQRQWYSKYLADPTDLTFIILLKTGLPVGMMALYAIDQEAGTAMMGRVLTGQKAYRRHGIATEAGGLCLDYGFNTLRLRRVALETYNWNIAAIHLYEKLGFTTEAMIEMPDDSGKLWPARRMAITAEAWTWTHAQAQRPGKQAD